MRAQVLRFERNGLGAAFVQIHRSGRQRKRAQAYRR
jgi:hypothetical protein